MFKRKRSDGWSDFVDSLRTTIDDNYEQVNEIKIAPLLVELSCSYISRIPLSLFNILVCTDYDAEMELSTQTKQSKTSIDVRVNYIEGRNKRLLDSVPETILQSPKEFLQNNLKLKNDSAIHSVESFIETVQKQFPTQLNWSNAPYTIIYHRKHNQIIVRFKFGKIVEFQMMDENEQLKASWFEYNKKQELFYLVTVIENCI